MNRIALLLVLLVGGTASADDRDEARRYFRAGNQAYQAGQYLAAAAAYEEAWRRDPLPATTFTLAQALRRQYYVDEDVRHLERALELYRRYLADVPSGGRRAHAVTHVAEIVRLLPTAPGEPAPPPPPPPATQLMIVSRAPGASARIDGGAPERLPVTREVAPGRHRVRASARGFIAAEAEWLAVEGRLVLAEIALEPLPARLDIRASAGAEVRIDGHPAAARVISLPAGTHEVTVTRRGHQRFTRRVTVGRGESLRISADLAPTRQRVAARWVLGAALAGLVVGSTTTVMAMNAQSRARDLLDLRAPGRPLTDDELARYNHEVDRRNRFRSASIAVLLGAAAVGLTGAALWRFDEPAIHPLVETDLAGVTYGRSF